MSAVSAILRLLFPPFFWLHDSRHSQVAQGPPLRGGKAVIKKEACVLEESSPSCDDCFLGLSGLRVGQVLRF